ncbi:MAG: hypothetical protein NXI16_01550 [Alphaproteobacteria bacterium]|nr:hypothetical protein [Alphaproteobacteria bacterium]
MLQRIDLDWLPEFNRDVVRANTGYFSKNRPDQWSRYLLKRKQYIEIRLNVGEQPSSIARRLNMSPSAITLIAAHPEGRSERYRGPINYEMPEEETEAVESVVQEPAQEETATVETAEPAPNLDVRTVDPDVVIEAVQDGPGFRVKPAGKITPPAGDLFSNTGGLAFKTPTKDPTLADVFSLLESAKNAINAIDADIEVQSVVQEGQTRIHIQIEATI